MHSTWLFKISFSVSVQLSRSLVVTMRRSHSRRLTVFYVPLPLRPPYRQKASSLATELAGARGRLSAIEEALTAAQGRNAALEQKIATAQTAHQEIEARLRPIAKTVKRAPATSKGLASALRRRKP